MVSGICGDLQGSAYNIKKVTAIDQTHCIALVHARHVLCAMVCLVYTRGGAGPTIVTWGTNVRTIQGEGLVPPS